MSEKIEDYLHLYLGCEIMYYDQGFNYPPKAGKLTVIANKGKFGTTYEYWENKGIIFHTQQPAFLKPVFRTLSDMSEEEKNESHKFNVCDQFELAEWFRYLLSRHFDLFNLIPEGLAIDASKLKTPQS
jgi:hypothetical protein